MPEEEEIQEEKKEEKTERKFSIRNIFRFPLLLKWAGITVALFVASYFLVERVIAPVLSSPGLDHQMVETETPEQKIGPIYRFEPIIVNLNEEGARRYLKISINLELDSKNTMREIDRLKPRLLDCLITLLSGKQLEDVEGVKGKNDLRKEIVARINRHLNTGIVVNAYFVEFMIQ